MRVVIYLGAFPQNTDQVRRVVDLDVNVKEDFDLEAFFDGANGYGPYAVIRDNLPRSFSVGDTVWFPIPLIDPNAPEESENRCYYHRCESVGWYSMTEAEYWEVKTDA